MRGLRTNIDFSKHELIIKESEDLLVHHLKIPDRVLNNIKFINTNDILAVTGDFGNYIFCREFHPSPDGYVSDGYWKEKMTYISTQEPNEFDEEGTINEINELLSDVDQDLTEEEIEYLNECLDKVNEGKFDYERFAYREGVGRFQDAESVPYCSDTINWLKIVFDGFDEICRRLKEKQNKDNDGK